MKKYKMITIWTLLLSMSFTGCATPANDSTVLDTKSNQNQTIQDINTKETMETSFETEKNDSKIDEEIINETTVHNNSEEETVIEEELYIDEFEEEEALTSTQRNSINMCNYITVLTQQINASSNSRIYLESVQESLLNDIYPNAVDTKTQEQINKLWRTIDGYRMINVKRERLDFIYEQNKAQALRQAIPNPLGLLSAVESGSLLKTAASVLYMAVDSAASYQAASTQADLKYLQDNWEFDDQETSELSASQLNLLNYSINMARDNGFPGEWALTDKSVENFVKWSNEDNVVSRIAWFEANEEIYREFRTYWLELVKSYYEYADKYNDLESYEKCLEAIQKYEEVATRIFRKDYDYAETLPLVILAAKETMDNNEYMDIADKYTNIILDNCDEENWALRYFTAQIYIDLYANTENEFYLSEAYRIAFENVNILSKEQQELNATYLANIVKAEVKNGATKEDKKEVKEYNKLLEEKRKVELPPVSEAFYLNCDLLFALVDELEISDKDKMHIDTIIHEDGEKIFLTESLDNRFWASRDVEKINADDIEITFDGEEFIVPAICMTDRTEIKVLISGEKELTDWKVKKVKRSKNGDVSEFMVTLTSEEAKKYKYSEGDSVNIIVTPVVETPDEVIVFTYNVVSEKTLGFIEGVKFERVTK